MKTWIPRPPQAWLRTTHPLLDGLAAGEFWLHRLVPLKVIRSISVLSDDSTWLHVSVSRDDLLPSWAELTKVKVDFIGVDREAYQVLPAARDYVNEHPYCLHLWTPLDGIRRVANLSDIVVEHTP